MMFCPACHSVYLNGAVHMKASIYFQLSLCQIIDAHIIILYLSNTREMMAAVTLTLPHVHNQLHATFMLLC